MLTLDQELNPIDMTSDHDSEDPIIDQTIIQLKPKKKSVRIVDDKDFTNIVKSTDDLT